MLVLLLALLAGETHAAPRPPRPESSEATAAGDIVEELRQQLMRNNYDYMPPLDSDEGAAASPAPGAQLRSDEGATASPATKFRSDEGAATSPAPGAQLHSDKGASPTLSTKLRSRSEHSIERHWERARRRAEDGRERELRREALVKVRLDHDKERRLEYFSQRSAGPRAAPAPPAPPAAVAELDLLYYMDDDRLQAEGAGARAQPRLPRERRPS